MKGVTSYMWSRSTTTSQSHKPGRSGTIRMDISSSMPQLSPRCLSNVKFTTRIIHPRDEGREEEKDKEEKELEKANSRQREPECGKRWRKGLRI